MARLVLMVVMVDSTVVQGLHGRTADGVIGPYLNPMLLLQLSDSLVALEVLALVVTSPDYYQRVEVCSQARYPNFSTPLVPQRFIHPRH